MNISNSGHASHRLATPDASASAGILVAKKALDSSKLEGQLAAGLIESVSHPPAATATRGTVVNTYA